MPSMKPQASNLKPQQVFMLLAVGCHLAHVHCPQSMQHGIQPRVAGLPAHLNSPIHASATQQHLSIPYYSGHVYQASLVHLNSTNSMSGALPQGSTHAGPPANAQPPTQGNSSLSNAQPSYCHVLAHAGMMQQLFCPLQHAIPCS